MEEDDPLLHEVNKTKGFFEKAKLKCLAQRPGHFSWLSLAQIKNLGSWDVHYPRNPLTPFGPMDGFSLDFPLFLYAIKLVFACTDNIEFK